MFFLLRYSRHICKKILGQLVHCKQYTDAEIGNFNWEEKCSLIQSDPVTCARHLSDFSVSTNLSLKQFCIFRKNIRLIL